MGWRTISRLRVSAARVITASPAQVGFRVEQETTEKTEAQKTNLRFLCLLLLLSIPFLNAVEGLSLSRCAYFAVLSTLSGLNESNRS